MDDNAGPADGEAAGTDRLAATLRRLWGETSSPRRGPKPALTTSQIVAAAVTVADAEGLSAVSMARVAQALGVSPMALYRHIANKDELLVLMADAIAIDLPDMPDHAGAWRAGLAFWTRAQIDLILARPWYLDLPLAMAPPGPNRMRWMDNAFGLLRDVELTGPEKLAVIGLLAQHVIGQSVVMIDAGRSPYADPFADLASTIGEFADPGQFPNMFEALGNDASAPVAVPEGVAPEDHEVRFGINILLDGIAGYIESRSDGRAP